MSDAEVQSRQIHQISILYVDDEQDLLRIGKFFLERDGEFRVTTLPSAKEALNSPDILTYDAIVSDYQMPGMDGLAFLKVVREKYGTIPFILFTGRGREEVVIEAINNGVTFYLQKGGDPKPQFVELAHKIHQAVNSKKTEAAIKESEKTLSDIIDFLPDATFAIDRSGKIIAWNRAIEEMTGMSSRDMLGKGNYEYAIPAYGYLRPLLIDMIDDPDEKIARFYSNVNRTGDSLTAETDLSHPKGNRISILIKVCRLYNHNGEITGAIESIRDITDMRKVEVELQESEVKFRNLIEYSRDCILTVGFDGSIYFINPTGLCMVDEEDYNAVVGKKNVMEYVHPDSRDVVISDMNQVAQGIDAYISQYKIVTAKKREIWVESLGRKIPHLQSEAILVSLRDITARKLAEDALRESEEHFRALTEQSPDIIIRIDRDYRILYCNPRLTEYTGIPTDQLIGTDSRKFIGYEKNTTSWIQTVGKVFETGIYGHSEWYLDSGRCFDCLYYPEFGPDNQVQAVTSSVREITQKKKNEEEREIYYKDLLVHREFVEALLDAISIPVHWKDLNQRCLGCNQAFARFIGVSPDELIGKTVDEIWQHTDEAKEIESHDCELKLRGFLEPYQIKLTDREGNSHDVIISKNLFRDHKGNISGIVGSFQDVTDYNQLIQDLKNREEFFRMILTRSSDFFIIITPLLEISFISPSAEHLSGFLTEEVLGPANRFVHPDDFKNVASQIERLIDNRSSFEVAEFRSLIRDGSYILLEGEAVNCIDNPAIRGILITARDITSRRKTEMELDRTMRLFQTVFDSSPAFFAILDSLGNVFFANQAFSDQAEISDFRVTGMSIKDFFPSDNKEKCEAILSDIVRTKTSFLYEFQLPRGDGNIIVSTLFFPIQEDENLLIGFIGLDITEKKILTTKLDASLTRNEFLEKLVQERTEEVSNLLDLKDSLITGIAHELRTPLTPLTVLLPLLGEERNYSKRMEIIRIIESNTAKIANIVDKILHLANLGIIYKIEDISEVNIHSVVEYMCNTYTLSADNKEISIFAEIPSHLILRTSPPHFIAILDNVISNAVKYSKYGGTIRISADETLDDIILQIKDDGIGMTPDELIRIFEPFFKVDPSRHDRSSPGLGLSVTRRLIQAIGGTISIQSDGPDRGTEVVLTFRKAGPDNHFSGEKDS